MGQPVLPQGEHPTVDIVPGTVIPAGPQSSAASGNGYASMYRKLRETYRLEWLATEKRETLELTLGKEHRLPLVAPDIEAAIILREVGGEHASYEVRILGQGKVVAQPTVKVTRGTSATIGSRDGEAAPYLFLLLGPWTADDEGLARAQKDFTLPKLINKAAPAYPEAARKAKVTGIVVLRGTIGVDGAVSNIRVVESPDDGPLQGRRGVVRRVAIRTGQEPEWRAGSFRVHDHDSFQTLLALHRNIREPRRSHPPAGFPVDDTLTYPSRMLLWAVIARRGTAVTDQDSAAVARARDGDEAAFETLVSRHEREVFNLAWRMLGNREDALDAAQETFLRVFRSLATFRGDATFRTWLTGIAINVCRNRLASVEVRARRAAVPLVSEDAATGEAVELQLPDPAPGPEDATARGTELRRALERALAALSPEHREILLLHEMQGLS